MGRYVALGSSMAAGPGLWPRAATSRCSRCVRTRNYPHLVAQRCGLDLIDVTYSGATTANILTRPQHGAPPQVTALDGSEQVVTVTIGGNDVGYVPLSATLPTALLRLLLIGGRCSPGSLRSRCPPPRSPNCWTRRRGNARWTGDRC